MSEEVEAESKSKSKSNGVFYLIVAVIVIYFATSMFGDYLRYRSELRKIEIEAQYRSVQNEILMKLATPR